MQVFIDRCHHHGIEFFAGFRVNDNHGVVSRAQGVGNGDSFVVENTQFQITEFPEEGEHYRETTPLDFTHEEVREFIITAVREVVGLFAVDGIELCFRDQRYFSPDKGVERCDLMTRMLEQIRDFVNKPSDHAAKPRILGTRVFSSLQECQSMGLDMETWIRKGTVDYIAPQDIIYADFNVA